MNANLDYSNELHFDQAMVYRSKIQLKAHLRRRRLAPDLAIAPFGVSVI